MLRRGALLFLRSSVKFQGHTDKNASILTQIGRFRTVTPVWIHWWLGNDAERLKQHTRDALLFFNVIRHILRPHRTKNLRFWRELSISGLWLQFEFTDGFEMMHNDWCSIEEVYYYHYHYSKSSIKFYDYTGWKIEGLNSIWLRLLGRSQLSNPSDLPCYNGNPLTWKDHLYIETGPWFLISWLDI